MSPVVVVALVVLAVVMVAVLRPLPLFTGRAGDEVWEALHANSAMLDSTLSGEKLTGRAEFLRGRFGSRGLFAFSEQRRFDNTRMIRSLFIAIIPPFVLSASGVFDPIVLAVGLIPGVALAYLFDQHSLRTSLRKYLREIEFFIPIVMERVVIAVQAGLDVLPAIARLLEIDSEETSQISAADSEQVGPRGRDPVSKLLAVVLILTESGLTFEDALHEVAGSIDSAALKHCFIHLAVAQREGGELVMPLRELSESTQLYFQESVEEEIAAMPIRATMPLLCTFAGLILFFITSPLIQVLTMMAQAMPKGAGQ